MREATRRLEFDAGHRVTRHESKCRNAHGHRYVVEVTVGSPTLDEAGRVVDFGVVKDVVGAWIDGHLDHGYIAAVGDEVGAFIESQGQRVFWMPTDLGEPTAENIATLIKREATRLLSEVGSLVVLRVRVYETPNCWADV